MTPKFRSVADIMVKAMPASVSAMSATLAAALRNFVRSAPRLSSGPAATAPLDRLTVLANAGNAKAELVVALKYLDGDGVTANDTEAAKWLARAADGGEPVAQYRLGTLYERGRGVPADVAKARLQAQPFKHPVDVGVDVTTMKCDSCHNGTSGL